MQNLLQDIHYMAADKGETALAEVARRKAEQIESDNPGMTRKERKRGRLFSLENQEGDFNK